MTRYALLLALASAGLAASPALASPVAAPTHGELKVVDDAGLFTPEAIAKAKAAFNETTFRGHVRFAVHTVKEIPSSKKAEFDSIAKDANARGRFFKAWADEIGKSDGGDPIVALIYMDGKRFITKVVSDEATSKDKGRRFSDGKAAEVDRTFNNALDAVIKEHLDGDAMHAKLDAALADATHLVITDLKNTTPAGANHEKAATHSETAAPENEKGSGIMTYVCIGIVVLLGLWLVFGVIRALTGGGGGGGYGGGGGMGGGGYGGGGGGGGFMSGMLGGMFGGLAGSWMYNHFLGGGSSFGGGDSANIGGGGGENDTDTGAGNYDNGASAGGEGGDWGDSGGGDAGGGDAGGGGDWGGGGDAGGGGDFGGGGGDW